jgi:CBS domain-containing protein
MEIELIEIRDFLAQRAPFDSLPQDRLNELPELLQIRYLRRGSQFPPDDIDGDYFYIVRSGAIVLLDERQQLLEKLAEGDYYTTACQLVDFEAVNSGKAEEDTLLYLLPCAQLQALRKDSPDFRLHFTASIRERMQHAVKGSPWQRGDCDNNIAQLTIEVEQLLKKPPITLSVNSSIRQAAQIMSDNNVSSVMLMEGDRLAGIVTDRDLRKRCVAAGLGTDAQVREIMTADPDTIPSDTMALHAMMCMTKHHVHHLPVMQNTAVMGMLTASDLARLNSNNSAFIASDIRKAQNLEELVAASGRLPDLQLQLASASATALHVGEVISHITDLLTCRLIEVAQEELGPEPVPFVWVCGGSQARQEQSAHSDQDNALIISDKMSKQDDAYFAELAKRVNDGLNACGFVHCPGDSMAMNPKWRKPLATWLWYFDQWIQRPEPMSLMLSSIFFDLRPVHGDKNLFQKLQKSILRQSRENKIFIAYMASNALTHRPPLGFFRSFVLVYDGKHDDTLDIKHRGIVPITDIARVFALSKGLPETNTTDRLRAAAKTTAVSRDMSDNLIDALEFIANLRIRHQAEQIGRGEKADNYLPPGDLSELERQHLKTSFKVIQEMQNTLEHRYQLARFR